MLARRHTVLHEQAHRRATSWTPIGPEYDIVCLRIASAFEEVEENVSSSDVYVACICTRMGLKSMRRGKRAEHSLDRPITEFLALFDPHPIVWHQRVPQIRELL